MHTISRKMALSTISLTLHICLVSVSEELLQSRWHCSLKMTTTADEVELQKQHWTDCPLHVWTGLKYHEKQTEHPCIKQNSMWILKLYGINWTACVNLTHTSSTPRGSNHITVASANQILFYSDFFFIHTARVNYGNNKMCINKSEDRIVHYCVATVSKYIIDGLHLQVKSSQSVRVPPAGKRNLGSSQEAKHLVWREWCFGSVAPTQQPWVRKHADADRRPLHSFHRLICQIRIWCGEPSPAECTDMIAGTTSRESVSAVIIWLWESIWGGWVLIFYHSLNNISAWKNILSHKSKMTCFWSIISPSLWMLSTVCVIWRKKKTLLCIL